MSLEYIVRNQGYEIAYLPQLLPIVGGIVSIPTAIVSGIHAMLKLIQAIFEKCTNPNKPFFRPTDGTMKNIRFALEDARDLRSICLNNVFNIFTLGLLNCILTWSTVRIFTGGKGDL